MAMKSDFLCAYRRLVSYGARDTFIYNTSFALVRVAMKYELMIKKNLKETDLIFGALSTFNLGA